MDSWKALLHADPTEWLLAPENPSVRYYTLTRLLDEPEDDPDVTEARRAIMTAGPVPEILRSLQPGGYWGSRDGFYTEKYAGTVWQLIVLAELGADGNDPRIREACEFLLASSQDLMSGGFSFHRAAKTGGGRHGEVIPCLSGNMLWCLVRFGYQDDPRVRRGIEWFLRFQRYDDGDGNPPAEWPYDRYEMCWGRHTCHMGIVKMLKAFEAVPETGRSDRMREAIAKGAEFLLIHRIHRQSHNPDRTSKPGWLKPGFPLMYQTDILEILLILTRLGYRDERMREAFDVLLSKQGQDGRWPLENTFNGKFLVDIEEKGKPSKFITLRALEVLKNTGWSRRA